MTRRGRTWGGAAASVVVLSFAACGSSALSPAGLDTRNDTCHSCRMTVSDARFAAQVVAPGEEPRFFDDIGCLASYVGQHRTELDRAAAYVADHRTKAWVPAVRAVFVRVPRVETPMGSHVLAHTDASSREADPEAAGGAPLAAAELFGPKGPPSAGLDREVPR